MTNLDSRTRKMVCLVIILVLLVPIYFLGAPASGRGDKSERSSGGLLAKYRDEYDLGESDIGQVDPTSSAMNFLLLGLRGIAVNKLRLELEEHKNRKEWAEMRAKTDAVTSLQPHYVEVWRYLGWNLSYNVSAEWDAVPDRYYWVKEGGKVMQKSTTRNRDVPELYWECGKTWANKVGRSDEWKYFRQYFRLDPDQEHWPGGPDRDINPNDQDNYLLARKWYQLGNEKEMNRAQHIMMRSIFRSYPARTLLDYADALQREGVFTQATVELRNVNGTVRQFIKRPLSVTVSPAAAGDNSVEVAETRFFRKDDTIEIGSTVVTVESVDHENSRLVLTEKLEVNIAENMGVSEADKAEGKIVKEWDVYPVDAWDKAARVWIQDYGSEEFDTGECVIKMETDEDELRTMNADRDINSARLKKYLDLYQNTVNYRYWRTRCLSEKEKDTALAHELFHLGEAAFKKGSPENAIPLIEEGMKKYRALLEAYPDLIHEDLTKEEGMWAIMIWRRSLQLNAEPIPTDFPLLNLWNKNQDLLQRLELRFNSLGY